MNAPIIIFTYKRKAHVEKLIESLRRDNLSKDSDLFIYADGYKGDNDREDVIEVRDYIKSIEMKNWFKNVFVKESHTNYGLAKSVLFGVDEVIRDYGKVIVLEDDLVVSPYFLEFMNRALEQYKDNNKIWSVSGFSRDIPFLRNLDFDVYFSVRAQSWSWATWKDRWELADWEVKDYSKFKYNLLKRKKFNAGGDDMASLLDRQQTGHVNSWAIRWCYAQFRNEAYTVQPRITLVQNNGQDGSGTNCNYLREYSELSVQREWKFREFAEDKNINWELKKSRKKVPWWKLAGSYLLFVILRL